MYICVLYLFIMKMITSIFASIDLSNLEKGLQNYSFRQLIFEKVKPFKVCPQICEVFLTINCIFPRSSSKLCFLFCFMFFLIQETQLWLTLSEIGELLHDSQRSYSTPRREATLLYTSHWSLSSSLIGAILNISEKLLYTYQRSHSYIFQRRYSTSFREATLLLSEKILYISQRSYSTSLREYTIHLSEKLLYISQRSYSTSL